MESDNQYLSRRADEELEAAEKSPDPKVRGIHAEFAARYRDAAAGDPPPHSAEPADGVSLFPSDFRILD